jgi:hypothetical protein
VGSCIVGSCYCIKWVPVKVGSGKVGLLYLSQGGWIVLIVIKWVPCKVGLSYLSWGGWVVLIFIKWVPG